MTLNGKMHGFLAWMQQNVLPGFREFTEDTYDEDYVTVADSMAELGTRIRQAADNGDLAAYEQLVDAYTAYFMGVNMELARTRYADLEDELLDSDVNAFDAEILAAQELWKQPQYRLHLDKVVELVNEQTGEIAYLVGDHRHAPRNQPYITAQESQHITKNMLNPWQFANNRGKEPGARYA